MRLIGIVVAILLWALASPALAQTQGNAVGDLVSKCGANVPIFGTGSAGTNAPLSCTGSVGPAQGGAGPVNSQSTSYTIAATDCNGTVIETGAFQTITLPASLVGFPASCPVQIVNGSSTRAQILSNFPTGASISGCGSQCLYPTQTVEVAIVGGAWALLQSAGLVKKGLALWADPSGSDNNDGLSPSAPLQHIQTAINLQETYLFYGNTGSINLGCSATYNENLTIAGDATIGQHLINFNGNNASPSSCVINGSNSSPTLFLTDYATAQFNGVTLQGGSNIVVVNQHSTIDLRSFQIGACGAAGTYAIWAQYGGVINLDTNFNWISATNCGGFVAATGAGAHVNMNSETITITGGLTLSGNPIFVAQNAGVINGPWTFSGSIGSALEYTVSQNGVLNINASTFPSGASGFNKGTGGQDGNLSLAGSLLLGYADNVNCNATGDTPITIMLPAGVSNYTLANNGNVAAIAFGLTGTFSLAKVGVYTAPSQGGTALMPQSALSGITSPGINNVQNTIGMPFSAAVALNAYNYTTLYLNVGTAQGGTCTFDFYISGRPLP